MLEAKDLVFSYPDGPIILDSVSLSLKKGEIILLTGPTGSGKSTLAKYLAGFIPRSISGHCSGHLRIDCTTTKSMTLPEMAQKVSLVQQDPESQICTLKVLDEVAFGPENFQFPVDEIGPMVTSCLEAVGSLSLIEKPTYALSGGEKQRVVIASMLACNSEYLILDEPMASLDPQGVRLLLEVLQKLKSSGIGILCIEHHIKHLATVADRILQLQEGKLSESQISLQDASPLDKISHPPAADEVLLRARNVSFSYDDQRVVKAASLDIHQGDIIALMGNNGSGKTTLLLLLAGLLVPEEGYIHLQDVPTKSLTRKEIARMIALVFQNPNHQIFERTVWREQTLLQEILNQKCKNNYDRSRDLLSQAGLHQLENRNPFSLSHGQKRRLNVSSSTACRPSLCLFDEPFVGQDQPGESFVKRRLLDCMQSGGAAVITTHDSEFALCFSNRIIFMDRGSILLDGPPNSVLKRLHEIGLPGYSENEEGTR